MGPVRQAVFDELDSKGLANSVLGRMALELARRLDARETPDNAAALVSKELRAVRDQIEAIPAERGDSVDNVSARHKARRANLRVAGTSDS